VEAPHVVAKVKNVARCVRFLVATRQTAPAREPESFCARHSLSLAVFERLETRVQVELLSNRAPPGLHKPDNFIIFVSSPL